MAYNSEKDVYYGYIYLITNLVNGNKYIGQTTCANSFERWRGHVSASKNDGCIAVDMAIRKYGEESFSFEEIRIIESSSFDELRRKLDEAECESILEFKTHVTYGHGYNVSWGGTLIPFEPKYYDVYDMNGDLLYSDLAEVVAERSGCKKNMVYEIARGAVGNWHNTYVFRKQGEPFDIHPTTINIKILYQYSPDGELVHIYNGGRPDAEKELGYKIHSINDPHRLCKGYAWSSTGKFEYKGKLRWTKNQRVDAYTIDGVMLMNDEHIYDASRYYGVTADEILSVCEGSYGKTHNLVFRFHGDAFDKYSTTIKREYVCTPIFVFDNRTKELVRICNGLSEAKRFINKNFNKDAVGNPLSAVGHYWVSYDNEYRYIGNPYKKRVDLYTTDGEYIYTFDSLSECARSLGIPSDAGTYRISSCCKGTTHDVLGFVTRYSGDSFVLAGCEIDTSKSLYDIPVNLYDLNDVFIKTYWSLSDAARDMPNGRPNIIRSVCDGLRGAAYKHKWYYAYDTSQPDKTKVIVQKQSA